MEQELCCTAQLAKIRSLIQNLWTMQLLAIHKEEEGGMTVEFVFCIPGDLSCFEKNSLQVQTSTHLMLHTVLATVVFYRTEPLQPITAQQHLHLLSKVTTLLWADPFSSWLLSS